MTKPVEADSTDDLIWCGPLYYERLGAVPMQFCASTLRVAMHRLGPAFAYDVYVQPADFLYTAHEVRAWTAAEFAIQINVHADENLVGGAWYVGGTWKLKVGSASPW